MVSRSSERVTEEDSVEPRRRWRGRDEKVKTV